ncbi:hypothetical protein [Lacibacter sediminis]|uniref:Uncharacterized protein n=1 Tax=Lacibacter sediminis TaxID=2760713 RepID=A0A7G5XHG9_9BACT|nr:hypothetical protein [Lacibacter sediminis]QNA44922.1 hypothetical protein H4075_01600 [Lacibacter sediminis]
MRDLRPLYFTAIMIVSLIAGIYLWTYEGELIRSPRIAQVMCFIVAAACLWALTRKDNEKLQEPSGKYLEFLEELKRFKAKAEIILPDHDACEFRNGTYYHEVEDKDISWMARGSHIMFSEEVTKTEKVIQSSFLYWHQEGGTVKKYASQGFPFDKIALQLYVMDGKIKLYVDRFDRNRYFFELEESK